jgi:hypothetical protein
MSRRPGRGLRALVGLIVLAVLAAICWARMAVTTDITYFLADESDAQLAGISRQLAQSELTRTIVLSVQGPGEDLGPALAVARALGAALEGHPEVVFTVLCSSSKQPLDYFFIKSLNHTW